MFVAEINSWPGNVVVVRPVVLRDLMEGCECQGDTEDVESRANSGQWGTYSGCAWIEWEVAIIYYGLIDFMLKYLWKVDTVKGSPSMTFNDLDIANI